MFVMQAIACHKYIYVCLSNDFILGKVFVYTELLKKPDTSYLLQTRK